MWVNVIFWDQCFATQDGPVFATHSGGRGSLYQITPAVNLSQQQSCYPANSICTKSSAALHIISWKVKVEEVLKLCSAWCGCYWGRRHLKVLSRLLYFPPITIAAIIIGCNRKYAQGFTQKQISTWYIRLICSNWYLDYSGETECTFLWSTRCQHNSWAIWAPHVVSDG